MLAALTWVTLAVCLALLLPSIPSMFSAIHEGAFLQWLPDAGLGVHVGLALLGVFLAGRLAIRARHTSRRRAAMIPYLRLWKRHFDGQAGRSEVTALGGSWHASAGPQIGDAPPQLTVETPPRCPRCDSALHDHAGEDGRSWTCPKCSYEQAARLDFNEAAELVASELTRAWHVASELAERHRK